MTARNEPVKIAVIGGSGVYAIERLENVKELRIQTPFGEPSDAIVTGRLNGVGCAFLPRHGKGHRILPSDINSRANIYALKSIGVEQIVSISACGSLREDMKPCDFVLPDQLFDRTKCRPSTFFGEGIAGHVGFADPFCEGMRQTIRGALEELKIPHHYGGTYVCIEGPQFSTRAESRVNRQLGFSIVGMTALPEAKLAREAGICYVTVALVTDYDVWKEGEEVTTGAVVENLRANVSNSKKFVEFVLPRLAARGPGCPCSEAVKYAVMTDAKSIDRRTYEKIRIIVEKYHK